MARSVLSREELFALVWEKPTREVAKELGVSDVAIGRLCTRLQVPKPPRGYWARVQSGKTPRRPSLPAFREEVDCKRRAAARERAAGVLSGLQLQFYQVALAELLRQGIDVDGTEPRGSRLPNLNPDVAAQILFLIQRRAQNWVEQGQVTANRSHSAQSSAANLVDKLLPLARPQLLIFQREDKLTWRESGPTVFVRLTLPLQQRIATLVGIVRAQQLQHVVMPLMAADHAWSAHHVYAPDARQFLNSVLCISADEVWVECVRTAWREEDPPDRIVTARMQLRDIMPVDLMPYREVALSPTISRAAVAPYRDRLRAFLDIEGVHEMMVNAAYAMEREIPDERLTFAERIWFGQERPFSSAREAWRRLEQHLEQWDIELEAERSSLARSILGVENGDIVTAQQGGRVLRIAVKSVSLYADDKHVTFLISGRRFRKDGTMGKIDDTVRLTFEGGV